MCNLKTWVDDVREALGADWKVWGHHTATHLFIDIPQNLGGGLITLCADERWWGPGNVRYAPPASEQWRGVPLHGDQPYVGEDWIHRMTTDIKKACGA